MCTTRYVYYWMWQSVVQGVLYDDWIDGFLYLVQEND